MEFIDGRSIVMGRGIAASLSDGKYHVKSEIRYTMLLSLSLFLSSRWGKVTKGMIIVSYQPRCIDSPPVAPFFLYSTISFVILFLYLLYVGRVKNLT